MSSQPQSTYAVSLSFNVSFSKSVSALVSSLEDITGNATLSEKHAPVHLTLGMFHVADEKVLELRALFEDFAQEVGRGLSVDFDGVDSFKQKVIFLSINKESDSFEKLKRLNVRLHELLLPHFESGGNRNYLPQVFFPHVALAVKLTHEQFEKGITWAHPPASVGRVFRTSAGAPFADSGELNQRTLRGAPYPCAEKLSHARAKVIAVSLARCHPYEEIARYSLSDTLSPEQRHKNMAAIHSTGGKLETTLRSQLFRFGFRFRKNDRRLAGSPDIVFPHYHAVIFVNGCFWHAHAWNNREYCEKFRMPTTNPDFWRAKFERNRARDKRVIQELLEQGWRVGVVWECSITGKKRAQKVRSVAEKISLWLEEGLDERFRDF